MNSSYKCKGWWPNRNGPRFWNAVVAANAMRASPEEIHALGRNVIVVATYWLNFQSIRQRRDGVSADDLGQGAYQVLSLVAPYLRGEARAHLDALSARYID